MSLCPLKLKPLVLRQFRSFSEVAKAPKSRPKWNRRDKTAFLTKTRGMTPPDFAQKLADLQRQNPLKWSDQKLAKYWGLSVQKVQGIIKLQEHVLEWQKTVDPELREKLESADEDIKKGYGVFSPDAIRFNSQKVARFQQIVESGSNKYQLSEEYAATFNKSQEDNLREENSTADEEVVRKALETGSIAETGETITTGSFERRRKEYEEKMKDRKEFEFIIY